MRQFFQALKTDFSVQITAVIIIALFVYPLIYGFPLNFIAWDTFGYYLYLPQLFIENDIAMGSTQAAINAIDNYQMCDVFYQAHLLDNGNHVIQYSSGMALLFAPFFLIGHLFAFLLGYPMDGYSAPYSYALIVGGYFYTLAGILLLRKVLVLLFTPKVAGWTLLVVLLGTNYFNIQTQSLGMPHIYLFAFYAAVLLYTIKWHQQAKPKYIIILGVLLGCMVLIRPTEIFALFIPLLWKVYDKESLKAKWLLLKNNLKSIALACLCAGLIISIQLIYWKYTTGEFVFYSYRNPGEGFNLDRPHLLEFLFSYRKGWLLYTPLMFLPFLAVLVKHKSEKNWLLPFLIFSAFTIYVSSCWSAWWYAASFSQRTMVQSYPLFAIAIAAFISWLMVQAKLKYVLNPLIGLLLLFNLFQSWQFMRGILPPDRITKEYYWAIFGQTTLPENASSLLSIDRNTATFDADKFTPYWSRTLEEEHGENLGLLELDESNEWGMGIKTPFEESCSSTYCWYKIEFEAMVPKGSNPAAIELIAHFTYIDQPYGYKAYPLNSKQSVPNDTWVKFEFLYLSPHARTPQDRFICFIWGHLEQVYYKNFKVTSYIEKS